MPVSVLQIKQEGFCGKIAEGEPQKLEHHDIRWITTKEIDAYPFCPADVEILRRLKQEY